MRSIGKKRLSQASCATRRLGLARGKCQSQDLPVDQLLIYVAQARRQVDQRLKSGSAVLVISQDLDEIFEVATEIAVINEGRLSNAYPAQDMTREKIGLLMGGAHDKAGAEAQHAH